MIYLGSDHRGFELKRQLVASLSDATDLGPLELDADDDYNVAARAVAHKVADDASARGVLICGSGVGMAIQANRFRGVRAVMTDDVEVVRMARKHNDVNVLCLGADRVDFETAKELVQALLETEFLGDERLVRRNRMLDEEGF